MTTPTASLSIEARLCTVLESLERRAAAAAVQQRRDLSDPWPVTPTPISLAALPVVRSADGGPNAGFWWAVQRVTVGPIGASTDNVTVYRGVSVADVQPQNALNSFNSAVVGAFVTWHPGGKGLVMMPDQSIVVAGTITGTNPMLNMDVIQGTLATLSAYIT